MALSKLTVNKHNVRRAEVFKANGLNILDVQYAHPHFAGYGHGECILCGQKHLKWLFSIKFDEPQGLVALAKVGAGIDREGEVTLFPVGSKCITDWLDAIPETPEKLEALKRWDREMTRCKQAMKAKVVEDLCESAGYESPEAAVEAFNATSYRQRRSALNRYETNRMQRNARKVLYKTGARKTVQDWLKNLQLVLDWIKNNPEPEQSPEEKELQDLLTRGRAAWANKDKLQPYYQGVFEDIGAKVAKAGRFFSDSQKRYYTDLLKKLEAA